MSAIGKLRQLRTKALSFRLLTLRDLAVKLPV